MVSVDVIKAVAVTAELCGRVFSEAAAEVFCGDLAGFPDEAVLRALARCRKEVRGLLTVSDVVSRIDDGRPGPEEAWAMMPFDESQSVVWTDEMAHAFGIALPLLNDGDRVAARMAFKEAYTKALADARDSRRPVAWTPSLGHSKDGRDSVLMEAVSRGRLTMDRAREYVPALGAPTSARMLKLAGSAVRQLEGKQA